MSLMHDLDFVACGVRVDNPAYMRLRSFIQQHEPWLPPQQEGFGPWIEYREGDKGPCVNDVVSVLTKLDRKGQLCGQSSLPARMWRWNEKDGPVAIVAYCVKLEDGE